MSNETAAKRAERGSDLTRAHALGVAYGFALEADRLTAECLATRGETGAMVDPDPLIAVQALQAQAWAAMALVAPDVTVSYVPTDPEEREAASRDYLNGYDAGFKQARATESDTTRVRAEDAYDWEAASARVRTAEFLRLRAMFARWEFDCTTGEDVICRECRHQVNIGNSKSIENLLYLDVGPNAHSHEKRFNERSQSVGGRKAVEHGGPGFVGSDG